MHRAPAAWSTAPSPGPRTARCRVGFDGARGVAPAASLRAQAVDVAPDQVGTSVGRPVAAVAAPVGGPRVRAFFVALQVEADLDRGDGAPALQRLDLARLQDPDAAGGGDPVADLEIGDAAHQRLLAAAGAAQLALGIDFEA